MRARRAAARARRRRSRATPRSRKARRSAKRQMELMGGAALFEFYARGGQARSMAACSCVPTGMRSLVVKEPVGPVAAFAPWNFPIGNPGRKFGAPLAAGCSVILKPAEEAPASALAVLQACSTPACRRACAQIVFGVPDEVSRHLLAIADHPQALVHRLDRGRQASDEARRRHDEAHDDGARRACAGDRVRRRRSGARRSRLLALAKMAQCRPGVRVADALLRAGGRPREVRRRLHSERASRAKVGDGLDEGVDMGPMANPRRPDAIEGFIDDAVKHGAQGAHRRRADREQGLLLRSRP